LSRSELIEEKSYPIFSETEGGKLGFCQQHEEETLEACVNS